MAGRNAGRFAISTELLFQKIKIHIMNRIYYYPKSNSFKYGAIALQVLCKSCRFIKKVVI